MISIILATTHRPTIGRMLLSLLNQEGFKDEILLVGPESLSRFASGHIKHIFCEPGNNWGHTERNYAMQFAKGSHLWFVDDDDITVPGALAIIKKICAENPDRPIMFRMADANGLVLWRYKEVAMCNQGTPQLIVPNNPAKLGVWGNRYEGDYDFAVSTLEKYPADALVWSQSIIYLCRPKNV